MVRKRAAGAGRKRSPSPARPLTIRIDDELRRELETAANNRARRKRKWNLSQEILCRLRASVARERELERNPATRALNYLISTMADLHAESASRHGRLTKQPWTRNPFLFRSFKLAVGQLLDALEPPGDPQSFDPKPGDLLPFDTPEDMADFASKELLETFSLPVQTIRSLLRMKIYDDEIDQSLYALLDARRDLGMDEQKESKR